MASGDTITSSLSDSLPTVIASARIIREHEGVMPQLVDKVTFEEGTGLDWNEISLSALTASSVTETTDLKNPQQLADSLFTITPTLVGILVVITDRTARRISKNVFAKTGSLAQNAIQRKKDEDGITVLDGANTSIPGASGTTLSFGHIAAAVTRITGNATEPGKPPIYCVLHGYQIKDIYDELVGGVGTMPIPEGITARVLQDGFRGRISGAQIFEDGNISIATSTSAKGGVFAREAIVLVQGAAPRAVMVRDEALGGGASKMYYYDEYAYGERSDNNWLYEIWSDATAPTS